MRRFPAVENHEDLDRTVAELNSAALLSNYRAIEERVSGLALLPMVKANAYGHGMEWVGRQLMGMSNLHGFGVATLREGAELRKALGPRGRKLRILVFSDTAPWSEIKGQFCEDHSLTPVLSSEEDWASFFKASWFERLSYEIQFNTGMNRLGMELSSLQKLIKDLKRIRPEDHPLGVFTHLAMSESPDARLTLSQFDPFLYLRKNLSGVIPSTRFHLANSGAIWNQQKFRLKELTDVVRPGLALYGIPPWSGAPKRGIEPVMTLKARILAIHCLKTGESIGYGGIFKVEGKEPVYAAIVGAGYADGIHRALGQGGTAFIGQQRTDFIGRVSMDLCAVRCQKGTRVGEWVELLGPQIDCWAQAQVAGTIPYELLTSVSARVKRVYA